MRTRPARFAYPVLLLFFAILFSAHVFSQNSVAETAQAEHGARAPQGAPHPETSEDENAQFKQSASVQLLARITGLSLEGAYWLAVVLNFAIMAGIVVWALQKNLPAVFRNRTATIQKSLEEARRATEEARDRMTQIETRLSRLDGEITEMRAASEKESAAEEERAKAAVAEEARRIVESAEFEIAAAAKAARRELTAYAADLAVSLAAKQIRVDASTDQALVSRFRQQLSENGAGNRG
jgi:F-type H+-transporting ATPase subunit b